MNSQYQQLTKPRLVQERQTKNISTQNKTNTNTFVHHQENQNLHKNKNQYENQRIFKISQELNKLDRLIQSTQIQSDQAVNILKHCTNYSDDQLSDSSFERDYCQQPEVEVEQCQDDDFNSKQKNSFKLTSKLNLDDLELHHSFQQDTIHLKNRKQGKIQVKKLNENKEIQQKKYENRKIKQIKKQNSNTMSKSQCSNLYFNQEGNIGQISDKIQDSLKLMENDRILSYSHHFQQEQESTQFHDMSSAIEISQIKAVDTTIKKAKQDKQKTHNKNIKQKQKSNHSQNKFGQNQSNSKKNKKIIGTAIGLAFQKPRILSNKQKQKIGRIKSQNKFLNIQSNFGRGINLIKEKMKLQNESGTGMKQERNQKLITKQNSQFKEKEKSKVKLKKFMFASTSKSSTYQKNCNFNSIKGGEPLLSKRNVKYNSISKPVAASNLQILTFQQPNNQKFTQKSKNQNLSKFHLNLQKEVTMKISDLKLKKNLCQIQTNYLSASVKITKQEIIKIFQMKEYSDQRLLKHFIIKSLVKFISQYNDQNWQDQQIDLQNSAQNQRIVQKTMKSPQKFIKVINKLPDILRRRNIVSQKRCKQFISQKAFTDQKIIQISNNGYKNGHNPLSKDVLYSYMNQLHTYLQFLLNNNMIHQTKRSHIFNPSADVDGFFSDRSTKNAKKIDKNINKYLEMESGNDSSLYNKIQQIQKQDHKQKKKQYDSQRKKEESGQLKRVNTAKNLKKTAKTKLKK